MRYGENYLERQSSTGEDFWKRQSLLKMNTCLPNGQRICFQQIQFKKFNKSIQKRYMIEGENTRLTSNRLIKSSQ